MDRAYDASLDEALEQTFPASDPISMQQPVIAGGRNSLPGHQARGRPNLDQRNREMAKPTKAELIKFRFKMVQLFSDAIALLEEEGDHELAKELRQNLKYSQHILRKAVAKPDVKRRAPRKRKKP